MRVARVFPRRTKATPDDDLAFTDVPGLFPPEVDRVEVSVAFSWDLKRAEYLAREWRHIAPTEIGGPAVGTPGGEFDPGRFLRAGYVITSRGCPNRCWFCEVWKREGDVRELEVKEGHNILDDNLLACSREHIEKVFEMLKGQRDPVDFSGGLEAARLEDWHIARFVDLKPKQLFFAYDGPEDREPIIEAGRKLVAAGMRPHCQLRAFVLCGYAKDTHEAAERRMWEVIDAGFMPFAMVYRGKDGKRAPGWSPFQKKWARPAFPRRSTRPRRMAAGTSRSRAPGRRARSAGRATTSSGMSRQRETASGNVGGSIGHTAKGRISAPPPRRVAGGRSDEVNEPIKAPKPHPPTTLGFGVRVGTTLLSVSFARETERDEWLRNFGARHPDAGDIAEPVMLKLTEIKGGDDGEEEG